MVENCLQSDLSSVAAWLGSSCLCLNVDKSNCMLIGSCQSGVLHQTLSVSQLVEVCYLKFILFGILVF